MGAQPKQPKSQTRSYAYNEEYPQTPALGTCLPALHLLVSKDNFLHVARVLYLTRDVKSCRPHRSNSNFDGTVGANTLLGARASGPLLQQARRLHSQVYARPKTSPKVALGGELFAISFQNEHCWRASPKKVTPWGAI